MMSIGLMSVVRVNGVMLNGVLLSVVQAGYGNIKKFLYI
jgi:hypothetical protein